MSECKHPFNHTGAGRTDRLLKALMPSNVAIDNRDMADLMVFAARFGKVIKYWDTNNAPDGDWSSFWESDYLFFLATVAASNTEGVERTFREFEKQLLDAQETTPSPESKRLGTLALVHTTRQLALDIASWGQQADVFSPLQQDIAAIVRNSLRQPLRDLIAYAKGLPYDKDFDAFITEFNAHPFAKEWNITQYDYEQNIDFIDPTIDYLAAWQALRKIFRRFVIAHERISNQATKYLKTTQNDPNRRQHPPHIVLFMSFLHLFKHLQNQLNALPEKHLDYYYNDILHLQNRREIPDHAHLVFQLARNVFQQTLPVGTLFRAGKTPDGKDMFYALERPLTLNQAQVVEVKTLLVQDKAAGYLWENTLLDADKKTEDIPEKMKEVLPFRPLGKAEEGKKSPVGFAVSSSILPKSKSDRTIKLKFVLKEDENKVKVKAFWNTWKLSSEKFKPSASFLSSYIDLLNDNLKVEVSSKGEWGVIRQPKHRMVIQTVKSFDGGKGEVSVLDQFTQTPLKDVIITTPSPQATLAASVASAVMEVNKLTEAGRYSISNLTERSHLTFSLNGYTPVELMLKGSALVEFRLDGIEVVTKTVENVFNLKDILLPKNEPVFTAPDALKNNKSLYNLSEPAIKFSITEDSYAYKEVYSLLAGTELEKVEATIDVTDLTDFEIYEGSLNRSLGHTQNVDLTSALKSGGLIVRCDEAFKKGLNNLTMNVVFKEPFVFNARNTGDTKNFALVKSAKLFINDSLKPIEPNISPIKTKENIITIQFGYNFLDSDTDGYIVIELNKNITYVPIEGLNIDPPTLVDVNMAYSMVKKLDKTEFFHLSSHNGHEAVEPKDSTFFPPFVNPEPTYTEGGKVGSSKFMAMSPSPTSPILYRGNLYIGVKDIPKLGILSLLFQVADGTEVDFDASPPNIEWSYLSKNETEKWQRFPSSSIVFDSTKADTTSKRSLVQSGVIEFQMPKDIKLGDTLLNPNYYWIRASATETELTKVGALPSLVGIYAQAGSVQLATSPIDAQHFEQPLPPTTIAQLKFREAAVRLIEQPYESFGGRAAEQGAAYHLRISERLRHKKRAITAWDYEHLVLEQFPEIRFVKCINHSFPESKTVFDTLKTGAVAVVVLPLKTLSPLQPQTNRSTLENIQNYLKKYCNGFTSGDDLLKVIPPQYQEVVVSLRVKFHAGDIEKFVHDLDNDIARFIAPWAFDNKIEPSFGKNLYKTELLSQIEALDYVDFIEDLYIENASSVTIDKSVNEGKTLRKVIAFDNPKTFITPNDTRTLLTSHQFKDKTPFETNHSIQPIFENN